MSGLDITTPEILAAMRALIESVVDTIDEAGPNGAPGTSIYLALQAHGFNLEKYNILMDALVKTGRVERHHDCYFMKGAKK